MSVCAIGFKAKHERTTLFLPEVNNYSNFERKLIGQLLQSGLKFFFFFKENDCFCVPNSSRDLPHTSQGLKGCSDCQRT